MDEIIHKFTEIRENAMGRYSLLCRLFQGSKVFSFPQVIYKLSIEQNEIQRITPNGILSIEEVTTLSNSKVSCKN